MIFFYFKKKLCFAGNIFRFLCFDECRNFKICDIIINMSASQKFHYQLFLQSPGWNQNEIWSGIRARQTFLTRFYPYCEDWNLVPGPFTILIKWHYNETWPFLVYDVYNF